MTKILVALGALPLLGACTDLIQDANTSSEFAAPGATGAYSAPLSNQRAGSDFNADGDGYGYRVGNDPSGGFIGQAGIVPGSDVSFTPTFGSVTYSGSFELAKITTIFIEGDQINGFSSFDSGDIALVADFEDGTLTGGASGLQVDGRIAGSGLDGSVTYDGLRGALDGVIGADTAIGVFHGNDASMIYAGGFLVEAP